MNDYQHSRCFYSRAGHSLRVPLGFFLIANPPLGSDAGNEIAAECQGRVSTPLECRPSAVVAEREDAAEIARRLREPDPPSKRWRPFGMEVFLEPGCGRKARAR